MEIEYFNIYNYVKVSLKSTISILIQNSSNTRVFHQSIKARRLKNQVYSIRDEEGNWHNQEDSIANAAYYKKLLGSNVAQKIAAMAHIVQAGPLVSNEHK